MAEHDMVVISKYCFWFCFAPILLEVIQFDELSSLGVANHQLYEDFV